jgi:serine phosphatase RsbU (regulator of sigma subunit)
MKFRYKLFFSLLVGGIAVALPLWWLVYLALSQLLTIDVPRALLLTAASQAVHRINPADIRELAALPPDAASRRVAPAYLRLQTSLQAILRSAGDIEEGESGTRPLPRQIGDLYILIPTDDPRTATFLISLQDPRIECTPYDMSRFPAMLAGWLRVSADKEITTDEFGPSLSVYAPIRDATGTTIALLGYDTPGKEIADSQHLVFQSAVVVAGIVICAAAIIALAVAWWINRPIQRLHDGLQAISSGNLDVRLPATRSRDELGQLVTSFNAMADALRERRQLKRSLEVAAEVQRYLLPQSPPALAGWDIYGQAHYCDETGGDFFDFVPLPHGRLAVLLGDASGHGIGSALVMATIRAAARNIIRAYAGDPDRVLREINRVSVEDLSAGRFITFFAIGLTPNVSQAQWVSAGHEPCLLRSAGTVTELRSTGIPLGIEPDATFDHNPPLDMKTGDVLLLLSDGVPDAKNAAGQFLSRQAIAQTLQNLPPDLSAQQVHDRLIQSIHAFTSPAKPQDDVTIVVIRKI